MTYLIDAYNLMHAVGLLRVGTPAKGLERARERFLDWLADSTKGRAVAMRVVFDAGKGRAPSMEADHRGVRVRFAYRRTADDEIEELLAGERRPDRVTVVSNDGRVQDAGRRRGANVYTCEEFVDWLIATPVADAPGSPEPDKREPTASPDEMAAWLAAFSNPPHSPKPKRRKS